MKVYLCGQDYFNLVYMINEFESIALKIHRLPNLSGRNSFYNATFFSENWAIDKHVLQSPSGGAGSDSFPSDIAIQIKSVKKKVSVFPSTR